MKKILGILTIISLTGCASTSNQYVEVNPLTPINVDCRYAKEMATDLQRIVDNPNSTSIHWSGTFSGIYGNQTASQRQASAKTVLWTIRTRCPGY